MMYHQSQKCNSNIIYYVVEVICKEIKTFITKCKKLGILFILDVLGAFCALWRFQKYFSQFKDTQIFL